MAGSPARSNCRRPPGCVATGCARIGSVKPEALAALRQGITVEGVRYGPIEAELDRAQGSNVWITFAMREGKNREVRNVLGALGLAVNRLIRVSYGPFQLGELPEGAIEEVATRHLREQLGERIAAQANANFSGPIVRTGQHGTTVGSPRLREGVDFRAQRRKSGEGDSQRPQTRGDTPSPGSLRDPTSPHKRGEARAPTPDKPRKRHRGHKHVWRDEGKPVRSKFRGTRAERREPRAPADHGETGILSDRKGRKVTLVRLTGKGEPDKRAPRRAQGDAPNPRSGRRSRRGFDRRSGPRPSRPRER